MPPRLLKIKINYPVGCTSTVNSLKTWAIYDGKEIVVYQGNQMYFRTKGAAMKLLDEVSINYMKKLEIRRVEE